MKEPDRIKRNVERLRECYPAFAARVARVIGMLEHLGYRPRIQDAWRSPAAQLEAYNTGHSKLRWGFHSAASPTGKPEALAVDLLDDDAPLSPSKRYLFTLARCARVVGGVETGILWGLPPKLREAGAAAIKMAPDDTAPVDKLKVSWDPAHVQAAGITVAEAKAGKRPR